MVSSPRILLIFSTIFVMLIIGGDELELVETVDEVGVVVGVGVLPEVTLEPQLAFAC
jgi:hypothetical protein